MPSHSRDIHVCGLIHFSILFWLLQVEVKIGHSRVDEKVNVSPQERISDIRCLGQFIEFLVTEQNCEINAEDEVPDTINPFTISMATQRQQKSLPQRFEVKKPNRKLDFKNDLLSWLQEDELGWTADAAADQGGNFVNCMADVLWYIDGHEGTLQDRGCEVPSMFKHFKGYNKPGLTKHRKRKHSNLNHVDVLGFSERLFHICSCSYLKRDAWKGVFYIMSYIIQTYLALNFLIL